MLHADPARALHLHPYLVSRDEICSSKCAPVADDPYLSIVPRAMRVHGLGLQWIESIGVANKTQRLLCSWALPNDSKHNEMKPVFFDGFIVLTSRSDA